MCEEDGSRGGREEETTMAAELARCHSCSSISAAHTAHHTCTPVHVRNTQPAAQVGKPWRGTSLPEPVNDERARRKRAGNKREREMGSLAWSSFCGSSSQEGEGSTFSPLYSFNNLRSANILEPSGLKRSLGEETSSTFTCTWKLAQGEINLPLTCPLRNGPSA